METIAKYFVNKQLLGGVGGVGRSVVVVVGGIGVCVVVVEGGPM